MIWTCCWYTSNNIKFIISLKSGMNKEKKYEGQDTNNKGQTKKLRTLILSTNVNDYDTGE